MMQAGNSEIKQALLFMPDISGFTSFVNDTEIRHSQHIVRELLEILLDSNPLKMQVNEIEGDAILFYKAGVQPVLNDLLKQVELMYINFNRHLQLYHHQRICNCGACQSAINLKLKIIAHYGEVMQYDLKQHNKLFGRDVIVIHRLLKNNVEHDEYLLMTEPLINAYDLDSGPSWFNANKATENYDVGEINICFSVLSKLRQQVPAPEFPVHQLFAGTSIVFIEEGRLSANMNTIFEVISDLEKRPQWMAGVKEVEMLNHEKINRIGTQHRCIIGAKDNPVIVTEHATVQQDKIEMTEMENKGMGGCRYCLQQLGPYETQVRFEVLVKRNPVVRVMFNLVMKNKMRKRMRQSLINLGHYCALVTKNLSRIQVK